MKTTNLKIHCLNHKSVINQELVDNEEQKGSFIDLWATSFERSGLAKKLGFKSSLVCTCITSSGS